MRLAWEVVEAAARPHAGVVTTGRLVELGADRAWLSRQVRSGHWQRLHQGILLTHSGPVSWRSAAFGALLYAGDRASLSHHAAAYLNRMTPRPPDLIDVTIPADRRLEPSRGIVVHHRARLPAMVSSPWRTSVVDTALDLVAIADGADDVLAWLCEAVRARAQPWELRRELASRPTMRNRALARELLAEVVEGVESPLEGRYHRDVERSHGLPRSELQVREVIGGVWIRADRIYRKHGLRIELDGALAHPGGRTDRDTWRDNAVLLETAERTLRYRWRHVSVTPCRTTQQVVEGLRQAEPALQARPCRRDCPVR